MLHAALFVIAFLACVCSMALSLFAVLQDKDMVMAWAGLSCFAVCASFAYALTYNW